MKAQPKTHLGNHAIDDTLCRSRIRLGCFETRDEGDNPAPFLALRAIYLLRLWIDRRHSLRLSSSCSYSHLHSHVKLFIRETLLADLNPKIEKVSLMKSLTKALSFLLGLAMVNVSDPMSIKSSTFAQNTIPEHWKLYRKQRSSKLGQVNSSKQSIIIVCSRTVRRRNSWVSTYSSHFRPITYCINASLNRRENSILGTTPIWF